MNDQITKLAQADWPKVALVAIVAAALYYFFIMDKGPSDAEFAAAQSRLSQSEAALKKTQVASNEIKNFRQQLEQMKGQFQEMVNYMGSESSFSDLPLSLQKEALAAGAVIKSTKPDNKIENIDFYATTKVTFVMEGTYSQLVLFLSNVSKLNRLVTVEKLEMEQHSAGASSPDPSTDVILFTATFVGYKYSNNTAAPGKDPKAPTNAPTVTGGIGGK